MRTYKYLVPFLMFVSASCDTAAPPARPTAEQATPAVEHAQPEVTRAPHLQEIPRSQPAFAPPPWLDWQHSPPAGLQPHEAPTVIPSGPHVNVRAFGARGDGISLDTEALQRAFQAAAERGPGATVEIPPGVYLTGEIRVPPNIARIVGYGAVLKTRPMAGKGARLLVVSWPTPIDTPQLTIEGLEFDLNRQSQGWKGGHDLEHQAGIFLAGQATDGAAAGHLNVHIKNVFLHDGAGDGIYVHHRVRLQVTDVRARDIFRGALTVTGSHAEVDVTNLKTWGGHTGIDIEPNGSDHPVFVVMNNCILAGKFDVGLHAGSRFSGRNIQAGGVLHLYNNEADFRLEDSTIWVNDKYRIRKVGRSRFTRCKFVVTRLERPGDDDRTLHGVTAEWTHKPYKNSGQSLAFDQVEFRTDDTIRPGDKVVALYAGVDAAARDNWLTLDRCAIDGQFTTAISHNRGGNWLVQNSYINAHTAFHPIWISGYFYNLKFVGNSFGPRVVNYWDTTFDHPRNSVTHTNIVLPAAKNRMIGIRDMYRLGANAYHGSRTIVGSHDPTLTATPGFPGDVYVKSASERWVAKRGGYQRAEWERMEPAAEPGTAGETPDQE